MFPSIPTRRSSSPPHLDTAEVFSTVMLLEAATLHLYVPAHLPSTGLALCRLKLLLVHIAQSSFHIHQSWMGPVLRQWWGAVLPPVGKTRDQQLSPPR